MTQIIDKIDNIDAVCIVDLSVNETVSKTSAESVMKSHTSLQFTIMVCTMQITSMSQKSFQNMSPVSSTGSRDEYDGATGIWIVENMENNETLTVKIIAAETTEKLRFSQLNRNDTDPSKADPLNETNNGTVPVEDVRHGGGVLSQYASANSLCILFITLFAIGMGHLRRFDKKYFLTVQLFRY